jgi:starvation-inducible DNA-binding protein
MNSIGLSHEKSKEVADKLNHLLANYSVLYMNTRGFHWNIKGSDFFELHTKFEEIYNRLVLQIDEIAERILTLEATPLHSYSNILKTAKIKEITETTDGKTALKHISEAFTQLVIDQRAILNMASEIGDEGTVTLMSDYITEQEKEIWMYNSYLA